MTDKMEKYLYDLEKIHGDYAEFGVYKGNTFLELLRIANKQNKVVIGVDSFEGMGEPSKEDLNEKGVQEYPKGKLNNGGVAKFLEKMLLAGYYLGIDYTIYQGFAPAILEEIDEVFQYSFCYIDFDHYEPTKACIDHVWDRLSASGLILFDDYLAHRNNMATKAINEFISGYADKIEILENQKQLIKGGCKKQLLVRKITGLVK